MTKENDLRLKSKILVVDDMMTMRKIVIRILTEIGYSDFIEAPDGAKAWDLLNSKAPFVDMVISDVNMPNMSGLDLLKKLRGDIRFRTLPFILATSQGELSIITEAVRLGVTGYVGKPFDRISLEEKLNAAFQT